MKKTVSEIADIIGGEIAGDGKIVISGVAPSDRGKEGDITFAESEKHIRAAEATPAAALIVGRGATGSKKTTIRVENPRLAFFTVVNLFHPPPACEAGIHPTAVVGDGCAIDPTAHIGPNTTLGKSVKVGARTAVGGGTVIGDATEIGDDCTIFPNVTVYAGTAVGNRVRVHSGTVIGSDGFGYLRHEGRHVKIPQVGRVVIEDDVEIGSNVSIDRATMGATTVKKGTKIDNLVQIAHNDTIGENSIIVSQVGISGSVTIGDNVTIAGQVGISDHTTIGDSVIIGAQAGLPTGKNLPSGTVWLGSPARPIKKAMKQFAAVGCLPRHYEEFAKLRKEIEALKKKVSPAQ